MQLETGNRIIKERRAGKAELDSKLNEILDQGRALVGQLNEEIAGLKQQQVTLRSKCEKAPAVVSFILVLAGTLTLAVKVLAQEAGKGISAA